MSQKEKMKDKNAYIRQLERIILKMFRCCGLSKAEEKIVKRIAE